QQPKTTIFPYTTLFRSSHKEYILNDIKKVFEANDMDSSEFINELDDIKISKKKTELLLEKLKADVEDFELPSKKEVDKLFKKVRSEEHTSELQSRFDLV